MEAEQKKSTVQVIVHSFFVVPFLIAAFGVLVFFIWSLLTYEPKGAEEYLADVKIGSATKRWQSAFELSRLLADPDMPQVSDRFVSEMLSAYEYALRDPDTRVRQYLIRAMGQTANPSFQETIQNALNEQNEDVVADAIYSLSFFNEVENVKLIVQKTDHPSSLVRNRAAIALGMMNPGESFKDLRSLVSDPEPNVRWNAAVSLAKHGDPSGRNVLMNLLDRSYLAKFSGVDRYEREQTMKVAVQAAAMLGDPEIDEVLKVLSVADENLQLRDLARKALKL
jgi:HEAT repeat protein|tara:strand:- start:421 stop:1263 length:843 start_codon:yes stop_codon:yes gene_type:complete